MSKSTSRESNESKREVYRRARLLTVPDLDIESTPKLNLLEERVLLQEDVDEISAQLRNASAELHKSGKYSDVDWFKKAQYAKKAKGLLIQKIQLKLSHLKEKEKLENMKAWEESGFRGADMLGLTPDDWRGFKRVVKVLRGRVDALEEAGDE